MDVKSLFLCVFNLTLQLVCGQYLTSPCPGILDFENYDANGETYGNITLIKPNGEKGVPLLEVRINFSVVGAVHNDYKGRIAPVTSNLVRKYNKGQAVKYQVLFPRTETPPKVTELIINGNTICQGSGDEPGPQTTNLNLRYKSRGGSRVDPLVTTTKVQESTSTTQKQIDYIPTPQPVLLSLGNQMNSLITTEECGLVVGGNDKVALINNGISFERGEIPWLVAIYKSVEQNLVFICGGTLVSDRHVITAAHCMSRRGVNTSVTELLIKVGVHNLNNWGDTITVNRNVLEAKIFEGYDSFTLKNDILILIMDQRVKFNHYIRPACLWSGDTELSRVVRGIGVVAGWGARNEMGPQLYNRYEPQMVRVPIVSTKECRASKSDFHSITYNNTLCAGGRDGVGPCTGDSGGGLYLLDGGKWKLRGIVSVSLSKTNGILPCNLNEYVVYTDTAQFLPWIRNILSMKYYD